MNQGALEVAFPIREQPLRASLGENNMRCEGVRLPRGNIGTRQLLLLKCICCDVAMGFFLTVAIYSSKLRKNTQIRFASLDEMESADCA